MNNQIHTPLYDSVKTELLQVEWSKRQSILIEKIQDALCGFDMDNNQFDYIPILFSFFAYSLVDEEVIKLSNEYIKLCYRRGWTIRAMFTPPLPSGEICAPHRGDRGKFNSQGVGGSAGLPTLYIIYGNYPHSVESLPTPHSPLYRHPLYFADIAQYHTHVDSHPVWSNIDGPIYLLTTETRLDRYAHILLELCKVKAPLNKVIKYCGGWADYTGDKNHDRYICASINHEEVCTHFINSSSSSASFSASSSASFSPLSSWRGVGGTQASPPANYCLVLEDDFSFIDDVDYIHNSLQQFFENKHRCVYKDFYVCFLSYSKWGNVEDIPNDSNDLVKKIKQLINNPDLRQKLIKLGQQQLKKYSWTKTAKQTMAVYKNCLN